MRKSGFRSVWDQYARQRRVCDSGSGRLGMDARYSPLSPWVRSFYLTTHDEALANEGWTSLGLLKNLAYVFS